MLWPVIQQGQILLHQRQPSQVRCVLKLTMIRTSLTKAAKPLLMVVVMLLVIALAVIRLKKLVQQTLYCKTTRAMVRLSLITKGALRKKS